MKRYPLNEVGIMTIWRVNHCWRLMTDDSGLFCDAYHTTEFGEKDCTILTIMETDYFPVWLGTKKERAESISDF